MIPKAIKQFAAMPKPNHGVSASLLPCCDRQDGGEGVMIALTEVRKPGR
jgi:hypothetical protein